MSNTRKRSFSSKNATPAANPLEGVTFDIDGEEFTCGGHMSYLETSDMARRISDLPTTDLDDLKRLDPVVAAQVVAQMSSTLLMALGEPEYDRFRRYCRTHTIPDEVVVDILQYINGAVQDAVEEDTGRPTGPSPRSPDGPSETGELTSPNGSPPDGGPPTRQPAKTTVKTLGGKGTRRTG